MDLRVDLRLRQELILEIPPQLERLKQLETHLAEYHRFGHINSVPTHHQREQEYDQTGR